MDITEDANLIQTENRKTNIRSIDFKLYRQQVQGALEPLFQQNPVLKKIRNGEPVTQSELDELAKLVLIQNPNVDIRALKSSTRRRPPAWINYCVPSSGWTATRWKCALLSSPLITA